MPCDRVVDDRPSNPTRTGRSFSHPTLHWHSGKKKMGKKKSPLLRRISVRDRKGRESLRAQTAEPESLRPHTATDAQARAASAGLRGYQYCNSMPPLHWGPSTRLDLDLEQPTPFSFVHSFNQFNRNGTAVSIQFIILYLARREYADAELKRIEEVAVDVRQLSLSSWALCLWPRMSDDTPRDHGKHGTVCPRGIDRAFRRRISKGNSLITIKIGV
jgi:hypothetical protein